MGHLTLTQETTPSTPAGGTDVIYVDSSDSLLKTKDGTTVIGATGGFDPAGRHNVVTVPFAGGRPKVLVHNAFAPTWTD